MTVDLLAIVRRDEHTLRFVIDRDLVPIAYDFVLNDSSDIPAIETEQAFFKDFYLQADAYQEVLDAAWHAFRGEPVELPRALSWVRDPKAPPAFLANAAEAQSISAVADDAYDVTFDGGGTLRYVLADPSGAWHEENDEPKGPHLPDSRPVVAAVAAVHAARTGGPAPARHRLVEHAIRVARDDPAALQGLIDWPLSGVRDVVETLGRVPEADRSAVVASRLGELESAGTDLAVVANVLRPLAARFAATREVRAAAPEVRRRALAVWQVPATPPGLTAAQQERIADLRERAASLGEVLVLVDGPDETVVAPVPGADRLAVRLPD